MSSWILGLTGGIGAGKTAATRYFESMGIDVVDADIVAREVVMPGSVGLNSIIAHFGDEVLTTEGTLNRAKLRSIIFDNEAQKDWLNALLHPLIREQLITQLEQATSPYAILCAPLLFENGLQRFCHKTLLIDVPVEVQIARTSERDKVPQEQVKNIIAAQMSREDKCQKADHIINNDRPLIEVQSDLDKLHQNFLNAAKAT
ncbi:dephospho-CoA kinase [Pseudoalteromonas luteoviolacea]|uniref:Dephospho-CoA kinase n=1 Tax=Pseudoalteromonas luteoviolacea TaxID=43657 RepID=A0A0C1MKW2_9GAMM|nr:dephospho-CoA kinase [Pseudoalteromonas luteoviolacea]KID55063.1 dephospho-CoA kinase [Pseudoalteromonas luteoviolacea]